MKNSTHDRPLSLRAPGLLVFTACALILTVQIELRMYLCAGLLTAARRARGKAFWAAAGMCYQG